MITKPVEANTNKNNSNTQSVAKQIDTSIQPIIRCLIGGKPSKLVVEPSHSVNFMSKNYFDKLHFAEKFKTTTIDIMKASIDGFDFSGHFCSGIEANGTCVALSCYIQEGADDFIVIGKKTALQLGLLRKNKI